MSLTARLLAFFLAALAVVLVGFSATLYALAHDFLGRQADERLMAALNTLDAAVEREPEGLDWEPHERQILVGHDIAPDAVHWEVHDAAGMLLARSTNYGKTEPGLVCIANAQLPDEGEHVIDRDSQSWQIAWRRIRSSAVPSAKSDVAGSKLHSAVTVSVGMSLEPMQATLRVLALTLVGLTFSVLLAAAVGGKWVCRRALAPVTRMATTARGMGVADLCKRLPDPGSNDELHELHYAFNGLLDRLQEAFERQRRFTGDASHQLRTPLAAILGQAEVALRRERSPEEYRQVLALVQGRTDHLRQITEALLFLARADADAELARLERIDLTTWLPKQLETWKDHLRGSDLRVDCAPACNVRAQPVLLGQLLDNLLDNAFKYSEAGTPVTVIVQRDGDAVTIAVQDAGPGIAPHDLPHIFEAFFRSAEARRLGKAGVGLGLAMAQRIAAACGGTLTATSDMGRGSRFTLRLTDRFPTLPSGPEQVHKTRAV